MSQVNSYDPTRNQEILFPSTSSSQIEGNNYLDCIKSFLHRIWNAVKGFFCCGCRTKKEPAESQLESRLLILKDKIHEIAKQHQFVWFDDEKSNPLTHVFSNFAPTDIKYKGRTFKNAEAAYQSERTKDNIIKWCLSKEDGKTARKIGKTLRTIPGFNRIRTMRAVVYEKFSQIPECKEALLATGDAYLVKHPSKKGLDDFWADDHDGTGHNLLGTILMQTREKLGGAKFNPENKPASYLQFVQSQV